MTENTLKSDGICSNCEFFTTCMYLRDTNSPIQECAEYNLGGKRVTFHGETRPPSPQANLVSEENIHRPAGLCGNCAKQVSCSHSSSQEGIWHCTEYA